MQMLKSVEARANVYNVKVTTMEYKNMYNWHSRKSNQSIKIRSAKILYYIYSWIKNKKKIIQFFSQSSYLLIILLLHLKSTMRGIVLMLLPPACIPHVRWIYDFWLCLFYIIRFSVSLISSPFFFIRPYLFFLNLICCFLLFQNALYSKREFTPNG